MHDDVICRQHRKQRKGGKQDPETPWSRARLAQFRQIRQQVAHGSEATPHAQSHFPPIKLDAVVWWDEHHEQIILGHTSQTETRIRRHPETGELATEEEGGVLPERHDTVHVKFPGNAGGCFGVAMRKNSDTGEMEGVKCKPFSYLGRTVIGVSSYKKEMEAENNRVRGLLGVWKGKDSYALRYGDRADVELKKTVDKKWCCIIDIIDHVISESNKVYAGTEHEGTFLIFHDALLQWWEDPAQEYLHSKGFLLRQIQNLDPTNKGTRYAGKLCGDSPEMCRGLDSHGFAHLRESVHLHTALSTVYDTDDIRRFHTGTPEEMWKTMVRCWTVAPTSDEIVQDILSFPDILDILIEHNGCVVPVIQHITLTHILSLS